jgi:hypothetical protein
LIFAHQFFLSKIKRASGTGDYTGEIALGNNPQMTTFGKSKRVFCAQNLVTVNQHPLVHHAG